jgi:hypothetical protein
MNASRRYWAPKTPPSNVRLMLAVDRGPGAAGELDEAAYLSLMAEKVRRLVEQAGPEAVEILEASTESLPELNAIRDSEPTSSWPDVLMSSDWMMQLLNQIDWSRESGIRPMLPTQNDLRDALREQTLRELIEAG